MIERDNTPTRRHALNLPWPLAVIAVVTVLSLWATSAWAGDYHYVRPKAATSYGTGDGSSHTNAWNGFADIEWGDVGAGSDKMKPGDVLYICGTHRYDDMMDATNTRRYALVIPPGSPTAWTYIRGNYPGDPGVIDGAVPCRTTDPGDTDPWQLHQDLGNGEKIWRYNTQRDTGYGQFDGRALFDSDGHQLLIASSAACDDGAWFKDVNHNADPLPDLNNGGANVGFAYWIFYKTTDGQSPNSLGLSYSRINQAIRIVDRCRLYIQDITVRHCQSYAFAEGGNGAIFVHGTTVPTQAKNMRIQRCVVEDCWHNAIYVKNGSVISVENCNITRCGTGVYFAGLTNSPEPTGGTTLSTIKDCVISDIALYDRYAGDHYGIAIGSSGRNTNNDVLRNTVTRVGSAANSEVAWDAACAGWRANYTTWDGNIIHDNWGGGLNLGYDCGGSIAQNNYIYNNGNETPTTSYIVHRGGIAMGSRHDEDNDATVYITNNFIANNLCGNPPNPQGQIWGYNAANSPDGVPSIVVMQGNTIWTTLDTRALVQPATGYVTSNSNTFIVPGIFSDLFRYGLITYSADEFANYQTASGQDANSTITVTSNPPTLP